jgi:hypothetical protein
MARSLPSAYSAICPLRSQFTHLASILSAIAALWVWAHPRRELPFGSYGNRATSSVADGEREIQLAPD